MYNKYAMLELKYPTASGINNSENYNELRLKVRQGFTKEDVKDVLVNSSGWEPGDNEKVYFFPGCSVPRFKAREKFNVTIKPKYATAAFVPTTGLRESDNMFDVAHHVGVHQDIITQWIEKTHGPNHPFTVKLKSVLLHCESLVLIPSGYANRIVDAQNENPHVVGISLHDFVHQGKGSNIKYEGDQKMSYNRYYSVRKDDDQVVEFYTPAMDCEIDELTCPVYSQDEILRILNEDNIVIDEKRYRELQLMARSTDQTDQILVMELMANSDYEKSFIYLLMLLQEFGPTMATCKEATHVNFKGMLNFFDLDVKRLKAWVNIEHLTHTMQKLGQFNRANIQRITSLYADAADHMIQTKHFTKGPVLKPEMEDELDDDIVEDYDEIDLPDTSMNL